MKKRIVRLVFLLALLTFVIVGSQSLGLFKPNNLVFAIGDVTVNWGIGFGDVGPIFNITNAAPGDMESRNVIVTNGAASSRPIGIRGIKTAETGGLSTVLNIIISNGSGDLYGGTSPTGPKTLSQFFTDSAGPDGVPLSILPPGGSTTYTIKIIFQDSAGNEFQNTSVTFDLKIGIAIPVPAECDGITFNLIGGLPTFGTQKSDRITGTSGNDLIFALEGGDSVRGGAGDDCIIGGLGSDSLRGEDGQDVIFGNEGSDSLNGGAGNDKLFGNDGSDSLKGEGGKDTLIGGNGSDSANGGTEGDSCQAESMSACEVVFP